MSETMSAADIEALFAQNAAGSGAAPEPSSADVATATDSAAQGAPVPASDSASGPASDIAPGSASDGVLDDASEYALPHPMRAISAPAPEASRQPAATPVPMASTADAVLTNTAATRAEAPALDVNPDEAAPDEPDPDEDEQGAAHTTIAGLFAQYGKYVALFVGAGLISGSVVHFPLAPVRYAIIGAVGALIFAIASVVSELGDRDPLRLLRVAVSSLALAVGIGMVSGSIQHFLDIPDRAALLIPLGVVLSLAAFGIRHGLRVRRTDLALIVPWLIIVVVALGFGLGKLADVANAQGGDAGHGHETGATDEHGSTEEGAADGLGGGAAKAHGSDGEAKAAKDDAHAADSGHAEETDATEDAHAEDDADEEDTAEDDAHAADGHAHAGVQADPDDSAPRKASRTEKDSALKADDSHQDRLRLVP